MCLVIKKAQQLKQAQGDFKPGIGSFRESKISTNSTGTGPGTNNNEVQVSKKIFSNRKRQNIFKNQDYKKQFQASKNIFKLRKSSNNKTVYTNQQQNKKENQIIYEDSLKNKFLEQKKISQLFIDSIKNDKLEEAQQYLSINNSKYQISADINYKVENYWTALHIACYKGNLTMVNMLLFNGAEIEAKTKGKVTALMIAAQKQATLYFCLTYYRGFVDIAITLILAGADINAKDINYNTALHFCSNQGHKELVKLLLTRQSVNLIVRNKKNQIAMDVSKNKETKQIFQQYIMRRKKQIKSNRKKVRIHTYQKFNEQNYFRNKQVNYQQFFIQFLVNILQSKNKAVQEYQQQGQ